ncbi:hypothetical protein [Maribacter sp. 2210JD10-5]|uniref:hypothetical protein n=1 Tax=Maribacter sp. 2210JD10-5 TaxID=3386272 RepID=UPI0039BC3E03
MKNLVLLFTAILFSTTGAFANGTVEDKVALRNAYRNNNSFIFVENGITFSVYPDGEFDFYIEDYVTGRRNGITFNSGFDYNPYAQYDDYGAVIQVENVPIFYDYYGRVSQIGDVDIRYRNGRVRRLGGMTVFYNNRGFFDYHTGFINIYNRNYVYRPFHRWFVRPSVNLCLVYNRPYRRFYTPIRYTYYNPYRFNTRRAYVNIGRTHRYNRVRQERARVYRNDRRVAVRNNNSLRNNRSIADRGDVRSNRTVSRRDNNFKSERRVGSNNTVRRDRGNVNRTSSDRRVTANTGRNDRNNVGRTNTVKRNTTVVKRGNNNTVRNNQGRTVTKREVTRTPRSTTVKRSTTTYKKPVNRNTNVRSNNGRTQRAVAQSRTQRNSNTRSVSKAPSRSRTTVKRSSSSRSVSKAPSRSSRSNDSRSATVRSSRRQ